MLNPTKFSNFFAVKLISAAKGLFSCRYPILSLFLFVSFYSVAQNPDTIIHKGSDSVNPGFIDKVTKIFKDGAEKSAIEYREEKSNFRREKLLDEIQKTTLKAKTLLKHGNDSSRINAEINDIQKWAEIASEGVLVNRGSIQTHRNLTTTAKILSELLSQANKRKSLLDSRQKALETYRLIIDSLNIDSSFSQLPTDSAMLVKYLAKYLYVARTMQPIDSSLTANLGDIYLQQGKVNREVYQLNASIEEVDNYLKQLSGRIFEKEVSVLDRSSLQTSPFREILSVSGKKGKLILYFYVKNHFARMVLVLLLVLASTLFLRSLKGIISKEKLLRKDFAGQLVLRYPFLSAIILVFSLFQFIFPDPPFIFNIILWSLSAIALSFVMSGFITAYWMKFWLAMLGLFLVSCFFNLILQATNRERWMMLLLSISGVAIGLFFLLRGQTKNLKEKLIVYFIAFEVLFELLSIVANISGRYNLGKSLMTIGFLNVILGILFLWTIRLINEGLKLAASVYSRQERKLFYINFDKIGDKAPKLLYAILIIAWVILLGRNFYAFRLITEPIKQFFFTERAIGSYTFSISNILVFFVVMFFAVIISRIISFFGSDMTTRTHANEIKERKVGLGSWLLLIRVMIISVGLFLALSAAGFPLDRITIVLGALGVGVGFGLQGLVGHLVSGIVIAFEKPVNVGDIVEISGQVGTVKSIGFRSSVISSSNGADIVIPNGDLLNAHLINWTLAGNKRLLDISIGVGNGTDLQQMEALVLDILNKEERLLKYPTPSVLLDNFDNGIILVKIYFWVKDYREGARIKSAIIVSIDLQFKAKGIRIPVPQQEITIQRSHPDNNSPDGETPEK